MVDHDVRINQFGWYDEEVPEFDDSWLLITNEAAANRILGEQYEDPAPNTSERRLISCGINHNDQESRIIEIELLQHRVLRSL